jgi:hypothetical protein
MGEARSLSAARKLSAIDHHGQSTSPSFSFLFFSLPFIFLSPLQAIPVRRCEDERRDFRITGIAGEIRSRARISLRDRTRCDRQ